MRELELHQVADYLREVAQLPSDERVVVEQLAGGVSNVVFYIERSPEPQARGNRDFVLKQARGQLRVAQPWFCSVERIWREIEVLEILELLLTKRQHGIARLPQVNFQDRVNYAFTMTAAPRASRTWKADLLAGRLDEAIATECGWLLGDIHALTWRNAAIAQSLGDRAFFCDLRVDPYYRRIAEVHPDLRPAIDELISLLEENCYCLVHGDFSPKNLLVWEATPFGDRRVHTQLMLIDCEVGHYGDPAFDLGFFLTHLIAKGVHLGHGRRQESPPTFPTLGLCEAFLRAYAQSLKQAADCGRRFPATTATGAELAALGERAVLNLAGCLLARVDGKSPLEYLSPDQQDTLRRMARRLISVRPKTIRDALAVVQQAREER